MEDQILIRTTQIGTMTIPVRIIWPFTLITLLTVTGACDRQIKRSQTNKDESIELDGLQYDTAAITVIPFEVGGDNYPFSNGYAPTTLTESDINDIENIFKKCVSDYNFSLDQDHRDFIIDLYKNNYKKQLVAVKNSKGEKVVWVNCLCRVHDHSWKSRIYSVDDGGNCYFHFKVNLQTKAYYDLIVNGDA